MDVIEAAVLRTLIYADIFSFALRPDEIHRYLLSPIPVTPEQIQIALCSPALQQHILFDNLYAALRHNPDAIEKRYDVEKNMAHLWQEAERFGRWLAAIPFVEMVALTGAVAVHNPAHQDDDFDYLIVARPGRVWFARGCAVLLVRIVRLLKREICPNYVLASDQLRQQRQDLFIAHEIAQMRPLSGWDYYQQMLQANEWAQQMLPNMIPFPIIEEPQHPLKKPLEWLLAGRLGDLLDHLEFRRKSEEFNQKARQPDAAAVIDKTQVKGHFQDHGSLILKKYLDHLARYGLTDSSEKNNGE